MNPTHPPTSTEQRWWRYVRKRRMVCPLGHHIPQTFDIPESGFIRCSARTHRGGPECGKWVFLYAIRGGGCVVVEVSLKEKADMEDLTTPSAMLEFLGVFPPYLV